MSKETKFGFEFGGVDVSRMHLDDKTGVACIKIKTNKSEFVVRVTKTGCISFFDEQGNECELVSKDYIQQL